MPCKSRLCALLLSAVVVVAVGCDEEHATTNPAVSGMVIAAPVTVVDPADATKSYVTVAMLTQGQAQIVSTASVPTADAAKLTANLVKGNLVGYVPTPKKPAVAQVPADPAQTFYKVLAKGNRKDTVQFDSMKYGPELQPLGGVPGNMVAAGWIYGKELSGRSPHSRASITVSDGRIVNIDLAGRPYDPPLKRYEESYSVSKDVAVYEVNTDDFSLSKVSSFAAVPVTADYKYSTTARQAAFLVFDKNYRGAESAVVTDIYFFAPQSTSNGKPVWDAPTQSSILEALGTVPASESAVYAGQKYSDIEYDKSLNYTGSTEPFEIVKDTFYYVGDNEVAIYLFKTADRLIMLDAGWPNSGYQYWKNIEAMGFDPRKITDIMNTHGHVDHYGTVVELMTMIRSAGGNVTLWGSKEDTFGLTSDIQGNAWNIAGALPAGETFIRANTTVTYESEKEYDFGNVKMKLYFTPGHSPGAYSYFFEVKNPADGKFYTFGYHGGSGSTGLYTTTASTGWKRLTLQLTMAFLQQQAAHPDLVAPQHTNQYPIVEIYQGLKAYNRDPANRRARKTMMEAMVSTNPFDEFDNFCEKRYQVLTNPISDLPDPTQAGVYWSIQEFGPFKPGRESGVAGATVTLVDGGRIIRSFDKYQARNASIPLLKDGIAVYKDSYVHDPGAYYVQFNADVQDATYRGFLPEGYQQLIKGKTIAYQGGPIESIYTGSGKPGWNREIIRTQRLGTLADAQAILATVQAGATYKVDLTKASAIVVPSDVTKTFTP